MHIHDLLARWNTLGICYLIAPFRGVARHSKIVTKHAEHAASAVPKLDQHILRCLHLKIDVVGEFIRPLRFNDDVTRRALICSVLGLRRVDVWQDYDDQGNEANQCQQHHVPEDYAGRCLAQRDRRIRNTWPLALLLTRLALAADPTRRPDSVVNTPKALGISAVIGR